MKLTSGPQHYRRGGSKIHPETDPEVAKRQVEAWRTCLSCRKKFKSWGAGNRICPPCGRLGTDPIRRKLGDLADDF